MQTAMEEREGGVRRRKAEPSEGQANRCRFLYRESEG